MQTLALMQTLSDPGVEAHFDRSAALYVDHSLAVYRNSVAQRLDLLASCTEFSVNDALAVLDIGCGGGAFLDMFLDRFPASRATGIDISQQMLSKNVPDARKTLLHGDALVLPEELQEYDAINVDTVMHHLVAREGYTQTQERIRDFLRSLHALLRPGGTVLIREIYHEYRVVSSLGSRLLYEVTSAQVPEGIARALRAAGVQTANVGVCFQTREQWQQIFAETGFAVAAMEDRAWPGQPYRPFGFSQSGDLHFVLTRQRPTI